MRPGTLLAAALVVLAAMPAALDSSQNQPAAPLTVMTFNIRYGTANDGENHWLKRREQLFDLLRAQQADVVGLQEALHGQIEEILHAVPGYDYVGVGRSDGRRAGEYAAILFRSSRLRVRRSDTFWFSDTPGVVKSTSWGNQIERICTWAYFEDREGPSFYLYNVHLDHQSQPSREKSVALLLARIAARDPKAPAVVTGDFNAGEANPAATAMLASFRDSFRLLHADVPEAGTFNGFKLGQTGGDKIDFVFVEPGADVLAAEIVRTSRDGRYPSDHFPVTARIRLR
jgi:endonuclease/exonuclease/phosphatase family metal-dependent hydrolase